MFHFSHIAQIYEIAVPLSSITANLTANISELRQKRAGAKQASSPRACPPTLKLLRVYVWFLSAEALATADRRGGYETFRDRLKKQNPAAPSGSAGRMNLLWQYP
jgi:hypothetical protein